MAKSPISSPTTTVTSRYAEQIAIQLTKTLKGFIEIGRILNEAKLDLDKKSWQNLLNYELPFARRTAEKLMQIASDTRITNSNNFDKLPPHWTSLYELTQLEDDAFEAGLREEIITPDVGRKEIQKFRKDHANKWDGKFSMDDVRTNQKAHAEAVQNRLDEKAQPTKTDQDTVEGFTDSQAKGLAIAQRPFSSSLGDKDAALGVSIVEIRQKFDLDERNERGFLDGLENLCRSYSVSYHLSENFNQIHILKDLRERLAKIRTRLAGTTNRFMLGETLEDPIQLLESALFQALTGTKIELDANGSFRSDDIRNPQNPHYERDYQSLVQTCLKENIVTQYTPIEVLDPEGLICLVGLRCLTNHPTDQATALEDLKQLAQDHPSAKTLLGKINE